MKAAAYGCLAVIVFVSAGFNMQRPGAARRAAEPNPSWGEVLTVDPGATDGSRAPADRLADASTSPSSPESELKPLPARAPGPLRVALQAGHWKAAEAPDELAGLRDNGGTRGGGRYEWEVNLEIAQLTAALLEEAGYAVEVLPATVPQAYQADLFIAIHADGNTDSSVHGFRVASPRRDATRRAQAFADVLAQAYGEATGIRHISTVTRRMQGYYAFNSRRYRHAIDPATPGVIIETGFLTSPTDQTVLVADPARAAQGIFAGVSSFLGPPTPTAPLPSTSASE